MTGRWKFRIWTAGSGWNYIFNALNYKKMTKKAYKMTLLYSYENIRGTMKEKREKGMQT